MSETLDPKTDQLKDRLLDRALSEVLGEDRPPDLSAQILEAAAQQKLTNPRPEKKEQVMSGTKKTNGRIWAILATAACLMIMTGGTWYMLQGGSLGLTASNTPPNAPGEPPAVASAHMDENPPALARERANKAKNKKAHPFKYGPAKHPGLDTLIQQDSERSNVSVFEQREALKSTTAPPRRAAKTSAPRSAKRSYANVVGNTAPTLPQRSPSDQIVKVFNLPEVRKDLAGGSKSAGKAKPQPQYRYSEKALRKAKQEVAHLAQSQPLVVSKQEPADPFGNPNVARQTRQRAILDALRKAEVPFADRRPITYPHKYKWRRLTDDRKKYLAPVPTKPSKETARRIAELQNELKKYRDNQRSYTREGRRQNPSLRTPREIDEELSRLTGGQRLRTEAVPGNGGDKYSRIIENPFQTTVGTKALSTFSIDVDTASYANVRKFLLDNHRLPPPGAVRIEELINYFDYNYEASTGDVPFAVHVEVAGCPWKPGHRLVRVALKGKEIQVDKRPVSNLVFLLDVSGSMSSADKLPLVKHGIAMLVQQLGENDRVAIVVYAGSTGLVLPSTLGDEKEKITAVLSRLHARGSTAGGAGIQLAYKIAKDHFVGGGVNRVILCTDGDFNVGVSNTAALEKLVAQKAKDGTFLTVLGFGRGNLNDEMMERISNKGNGNYHYIDSLTEARKVLVDELSGTLITIAKDVKIQIEFNPAKVAAYRLIGYENRMLAAKDFKDDKKDAGEIGAGHKVTALYEIVPADVALPGSEDVIELKYQKTAKVKVENDGSKELLTLRLRYKKPDGVKSKPIEFPITDSGKKFSRASKDFKFASAVASFGMLLRNSKHKGESTYASVLEIAAEGQYPDKHGYRAEFLQMVRQAKQLSGQ